MEIGEWVNCFILLTDGIIHIIHTPFLFLLFFLLACNRLFSSNLFGPQYRFAFHYALVSRYYMRPLLAT